MKTFRTLGILTILFSISFLLQNCTYTTSATSQRAGYLNISNIQVKNTNNNNTKSDGSAAAPTKSN